MSSHVRQDEGARLDGDLRGVTELDNQSGGWVDEVAAVAAPEQGLSQCLVGLEAGSDVELLLQPAATAGAEELTQLVLLSLERWSELVLVSFDEPQSELGVHLLEGHVQRVTEWPQ